MLAAIKLSLFARWLVQGLPRPLCVAAVAVIWLIPPWNYPNQLFALCNQMNVSEMLRAIKNDGRFQVAQRGSHRQFKHPNKPGRVTIAGKPSDELAKGTQLSILKQAGLRGSEHP